MVFTRINLPKHLNGFLYHGDNLEVIRSLPYGSIDLTYLDPPFFSGRNYSTESKIDKGEVRSFTDMFKTLDEYLRFLYVRLIEIKRASKYTGIVCLHLDTHAVYEVKTFIMDKLFGRNNLINDIIWKRSVGMHDNRKNKFSVAHDIILVYSISSIYTFNQLFTPYSEEYIRQNYDRTDENGNYKLSGMSYPGQGKPVYFGNKLLDPPSGRHWPSQENINQFLKDNKIVFNNNNTPMMKLYSHDAKGLPMNDLWDDCSTNTMSNIEKMDYPTQKPEMLLERIIKTWSNPGDTVADIFGGSGTTAAVSQGLGRKWITCDKSKKSIELIKTRLYGNKSVKDTGYRPDIDSAWDLK